MDLWADFLFGVVDTACMYVVYKFQIFLQFIQMEFVSWSYDFT
jgi:hypothetical protein